METTMWITKEDAASNLDNGTIYNEGYTERQFPTNGDQYQPSNGYASDQYCQDLDNLIFNLDDYFAPCTNENNADVIRQSHIKPVQTTPNEKHKVLVSMLTSEPTMSTLNVKTETVDWQNTYDNCQSPADSGMGMDHAYSPNSDLSSRSPGMDLDSPGSVVSSFSSSTASVDSGVFTGVQNENGFEIYHDLIMRHLIQDIKATCIRLNISQDPKLWTNSDCRAWLTDMSAQYHLTQVPYEKLNVNGSTLCAMNLSQFNQCFPNGAGETVHAQLQIWNSANEYCKHQSTSTLNTKVSFSNESPMMILVGNGHANQYATNHETVLQQTTNQYKMHDHEMNGYTQAQYTNAYHVEPSHQFMPTAHPNNAYSLSSLLPSPGSCSDSGLSVDSKFDASVETVTMNTSNNIHLWQFLRELLDQNEKYSHCLRWIDQSAGVFKIEDSHKLAKLWGQRKNRPAMNYDKLSRSLRQYYKKNILKKTTRSQRLVYQFLHPYHMC